MTNGTKSKETHNGTSPERSIPSKFGVNMIPGSGNHLVDFYENEPEKELHRCPLCSEHVTEDTWHLGDEICFKCWFNK